MYNLISSYIQQNPEQAVKHLENFPLQDSVDILLRLSSKTIARITPTLNLYILYNLMQDMPENRVADIVDLLDIKILSHIVRGVDNQTKKVILDSMEEKKRDLCLSLMNYEEGMVGAWMHPNLFFVRANNTCEEVIKKIANKKYIYKANIIFVTTGDNKLLGYAQINSIMQQKSEQIVDIMQPIINVIDSRNQIVDIDDMKSWLHIDCLPVINKNRELVGVIRHLDIRRALKELQIDTSERAEFGELVGELMHIYTDTFVDLVNGVAEENQ